MPATSALTIVTALDQPFRLGSLGVEPPATAGTSAAVSALRHALPPLAESDLPMLLCGESGVGAREWAEVIHRTSARHAAFVAIELGGVTNDQALRRTFRRDGAAILDEPAGGTLYLGSIETLDMRSQQQLADRLARREAAGARLVAGTTVALEELVRLGRFAAALYHRLATVQLLIPPLRTRMEDVRAIANAWLTDRTAEMTGTRPQFTAGAWVDLEAYDWPGNVHELLGTLDAVLGIARRGPLGAGCVRAALGRRPRRRAGCDVLPLRSVEQSYILGALARCGGNQSLAARRLGIGRSTLVRKLRGAEASI